MKTKIVLAGGTGFIGQYLAEKYRGLGYEVIIISRKKADVQWTHFAGIIEALDNSQLLINLSGKSVDCRYTETNKKEILASRTETTRMLGLAIEKCKTPPALWINSSTGTIYRNSFDRAMTEEDGEKGSGFSVDVAAAWENAFFSFKLPHTRQVALRISIVLGKNGGVMRPFVNLVRFGLGGHQGNGKQLFSWIHIEDLYQVIRHVENDKSLNGIFNCASPNPVTNKELMLVLRKAMKINFALSSPEWLLTIGAFIIGTETELILKSRWVVPDRLVRSGFGFTYPTLPIAIDEILN